MEYRDFNDNFGRIEELRNGLIWYFNVLVIYEYGNSEIWNEFLNVNKNE